MRDQRGIKVVGLTGGIGSGKSTIAKVFETLGVGIYIADIQAKRLMHEDKELKNNITDLFGNDAYIDNQLNRSWISSQVFSDKLVLEKLNSLVHPVVEKDFENWVMLQNGNYVIKEAAILFENAGYKQCDYTILVTAPKIERIKRVMDRDSVSEEKVLDRMKHQWEDEKKIPLADFIISNTSVQLINDLVLEVHQKLSVLCNQKC